MSSIQTPAPFLVVQETEAESSQMASWPSLETPMEKGSWGQSPLSPALTQLPAILLVASEVDRGRWLLASGGGGVGWGRQNPQGKLAQISCENEEELCFLLYPCR